MIYKKKSHDIRALGPLSSDTHTATIVYFSKVANTVFRKTAGNKTGGRLSASAETKAMLRDIGRLPS